MTPQWIGRLRRLAIVVAVAAGVLLLWLKRWPALAEAAS
jgi:hypothetical protein